MLNILPTTNLIAKVSDAPLHHRQIHLLAITKPGTICHKPIMASNQIGPKPPWPFFCITPPPIPGSHTIAECWQLSCQFVANIIIHTIKLNTRMTGRTFNCKWWEDLGEWYYRIVLKLHYPKILATLGECSTVSDWKTSESDITFIYSNNTAL